MRRKWLLLGAVALISLLWLATSSVQSVGFAADRDGATVSAANDDEIYVFITKTGKKYHRDGCRYLKDSKIRITLEEAKEKGYEPCKVCKPPK